MGKELQSTLISRSPSTPPAHFSVYQLCAPSTAANECSVSFLKEASLAAQIVFVGSVGVTCRLGAQNVFSSLGPSDAENKPYKPYCKKLFCSVTLVDACTVTYIVHVTSLLFQKVGYLGYPETTGFRLVYEPTNVRAQRMIYEAAAAFAASALNPDRERTNHSVLLWWNWLFCQRKFHSYTVSFC